MVREFGIRFIFRGRPGDNSPMSNSTLFSLRREVARTLRNSEFGEVRELPNRRFRNTFAKPVIDVYDPIENELYISYYFIFPLHHGSIPAFQDIHVPILSEFATASGVELTIITMYN